MKTRGFYHQLRKTFRICKRSKVINQYGVP